MKTFLFASATLLAATNLAYANEFDLDDCDLTSSLIVCKAPKFEEQSVAKLKKVDSRDKLRISQDSDSSEEEIVSKSPSFSKKAVNADVEVKKSTQKVASKPSSLTRFISWIGSKVSAVAKVFGFFN